MPCISHPPLSRPGTALFLGFLIAGLGTPRWLRAQDSTPQLVQAEIKTRRTRINAYPYVYYTPETELAFGAGGIVTFYTDTAAVLRPSKVGLSGYYSTKGQYKFTLQPQLFLVRNTVRLAADVSYGYYVDKFWGIGPGQPDIADEDYAARAWRAKLVGEVPPPGFFRRSRMRVGAKYDMTSYHIVEPRGNPFLKGDSVAGVEGGWSSGLGLVWVLDQRDNVFFPETGNYFQAEAVWYGPAIGSDYGYAKYLVDLRHYFGLGGERVLAVQLMGNFASGEAPFYDLPMLGGGNIMRGYYQGRYRDYVLTAAQGEVRLPLYRRFGAVGFVAVGNVAPELGGVDLGDLLVTGGAGLRFRFNKAEKVNLRADVGVADGSTGVYFGLEEAF